MSQIFKPGTGGGGGGTVTSFSFTDANGFAGTVTNPTTTPDLTLTTSVTTGQVIFASSGALTGDGDFTYDPTTNTLNVGNSTAASNGNIIVGGSGTGIGNITGGGGQLNILGGNLLLATNSGGAHTLTLQTEGSDRLQIDDDGAWNLAATDPGVLGQVLTSNGPGAAPTWEDNAGGVQYTDVTNAMSPYTVTATDYYISVDSTAGPVTINLPDSPDPSRQFVIKDRLGQAQTNNIIVKSLTGVTTVDQQASYTFVDNFESLECLFHTANYEVF